MKKIYIFIGIVLVIGFLVIVSSKNKKSQPDDVIGESMNSSSIFSEFKNPQKVNIIGYTDHAMEPFISRDGQYLFFNNRNIPTVNTNLHYATKIDDNTFQYQGEVQGVNTDVLEAVPSMDINNNFYYTSIQNIVEWSVIKRGTFNNGVVSNIEPIIVEGIPAGIKRIAMGGEISSDGNTLYYIAAKIDGGSTPSEMNILIAKKISSNRFKTVAKSQEIMKNINTNNLEYASALSVDELELYFTRAVKLVDGVGLGGLAVYITTRNSLSEPFGVPERIDTITGFAEAGTITSDGKILYYHKEDKGIFYIYKVTR